MSDVARQLQRFLSLALEAPDGPETARRFNRVFQFDLTDEAPFYLTIQEGQITVADGDSGLDWKYRDWERVTCVHTSARVLRDVLAGRRLISEAFFNHDLGFGPRKLADRHTNQSSIVAWLYALVRLAHEQGQRAARDRYLAELGIG
ncbi:MAG TPA: hypothetical protein VII06_21785 [Chloroflexota bacterium]|jgi:hypothetical protein